MSNSLTHRRFAARHVHALLALASTSLLSANGFSATVSWSFAGAGNWNVAANWSSNPSLPGAGDDVINSTAFLITHNSGSDTITSFVSAAPFTLNGGSLAANVPGTGAFQVNNTFSLAGGTLSGFVVNPGSGGQGITPANVSSNFINNITSNAKIDMTAVSALRVTNGLALNNVATISSGSAMAFQDSQTFSGNSEIVFGASASNRLAIDSSTISGATLTIASSVRIHGQNGTIGPAVFLSTGSHKLINNGTIAVDVAGGAISINPSSGALDSITNAGTLMALNGGSLIISSNLAQTGAGAMFIDSTSRSQQSGVRISGGTINVAVGGSLTPTNNAGNFLDAIVVNGDLNMSSIASERIQNGLTLNGTANLNNNSVIAFQDTQTFATGTIALGTTGNNRLALDQSAGGSVVLTLGSAAVVRGTGTVGPAVFIGATGKIINQGRIAADVSTGSINLNPSSGSLDSVLNSGTLAAANGGSLVLSSNVTQSGAGQMFIDATSRIQQDAIRISGGTINVATGGSFTSANSASNFLDGVTINGQLNMESISIERVLNSLTLNGTATLNNSSVLAFQDTQTFPTGTIVLGTTGNNRVSLDQSAGGSMALTLGSAAMIRGRGTIGTSVFIGAATKLINNGTISADAPTGTISLIPSSAAADSVLNQGRLQAINGGSLVLNSPVTNAGAGRITVDAISRVQQNAVTLTGGTISVASGGLFTPVNNSANFLNGVTIDGNLNMTSISIERVLNGLTLNGTATLNNSSVLAFQDTQTFPTGTIVLGSTGSNRVSLDQSAGGNMSLTIGAPAIIRGTGVIGTSIFIGANTKIVNNGTISADSASGSISLNPSSAALDSVSNAGTLAAANGGSLVLNSHVTNTGAGRISIDATSRVQQNGIRITAGNINVATGGAFTPTNSGSNFLDAVTVNGDINMTSVAQERVLNGLTLNGNANLNNNSVLSFQDTQTFSTGTIVLGATGNNRISLDQTAGGAVDLTLGSPAVIRGRGTIGPSVFIGSTTRLINNGTISADAATGSINLNPSSGAADAISGSGIFEARDGGIFTMNSRAAISPAALMFVADSASRMNITTSTVTGGSVVNHGIYSISAGNAVTTATVTGTGTTTLAASARLNTAHVRQQHLSISTTGTVTIAVDGSNAGTSRLATLAMVSSRFDLNDNDLIMTSSTLGAIETLVASGRNGGLWTGAGITSSAARTAVPDITTLGVLSGAEYNSIYGPASDFDGFTVADTDVLVKYTWYGDTDFNGVVDFDDYVRIDGGFNFALTGWLNGDLNSDGAIDFDDYVLVDGAFNGQNGTLIDALNWLEGEDRSGFTEPGVQKVIEHYQQFGMDYVNAFYASVPEPGAIGLISIAGIGLARRRRNALV